MTIVFLPVIERELEEYMTYWNSHPIRSSRQGNFLGGIPNDLFEMTSFYRKFHIIIIITEIIIIIFMICLNLGTQNYLHPIDPSIWTYAFCNEASKPTMNYTLDFYNSCSRLCHNFLKIDLHRDVTSFNCFQVYVFLINNIV